MGTRMLRDQLNREGFTVGRKHVRSLMARMGVKGLEIRRLGWRVRPAKHLRRPRQQLRLPFGDLGGMDLKLFG